MQAWRARADALLDKGEPREPERSLHASETFQGHTELKVSLDATSGEVIRTALRTAETADDEATGTRTPAERRADALTDLCPFFLDHQDTVAPQRRRRPHLNIIINLDDLFGNAGGAQTIDGGHLDPDTIRTLLCDSEIHRFIVDSESRTLDYGRSQRSAPPDLFTASTGDKPSPATAPSPSKPTTAAPGPPTHAAPSPSSSPPPADRSAGEISRRGAGRCRRRRRPRQQRFDAARGVGRRPVKRA